MSKKIKFEDLSIQVEKEIGIILGRVSHHIHPKIVNKIIKNNRHFKQELKPIVKKLELGNFLFENSDCVFPGVRRNINSEKDLLGSGWKNNIYYKDFTILNDNTFPRHIWCFLSMNKQYSSQYWKESGLNKFEVAHIFGHKKDEKKLEKKVFKKYDNSRLPYSYFTSASNTVLIPNGIMKPTDKLEAVRICFFKRHLELYGNNLMNESELIDDYVPSWYNEIKWQKPYLPDDWEDRIEQLLIYRKKTLFNKYNR